MRRPGRCAGVGVRLSEKIGNDKTPSAESKAHDDFVGSFAYICHWNGGFSDSPALCLRIC